MLVKLRLMGAESPEVSVEGLATLIGISAGQSFAGPEGPPGADGEQGTQGIQGVPGIPGAGGGTVGTGTLNFGARTAARGYAEVDVTGLSGLTGASHLEAFLQGDATADHSADEHVVEVVALRAKYLTASSMRVVGQIARGRAWGNFTFHYRVG